MRNHTQHNPRATVATRDTFDAMMDARRSFDWGAITDDSDDSDAETLDERAARTYGLHVEAEGAE